jgi:hypothetical protein
LPSGSTTPSMSCALPRAVSIAAPTLQMSLITYKASKTAHKLGQQRQESHCCLASWLRSPQQRSNINPHIFTSTESTDRRASSSAPYTVPSLSATAAQTMHPSKPARHLHPLNQFAPNFIQVQCDVVTIVISTHQLQQSTLSLACPPLSTKAKRACRSLSMSTTLASPQITMR